MTTEFSKKQHNYKPIFKLRLAGYLMTQGFVLIYCKRNEFNNDKIVYYFLSSPALDNAIKEFTAANSSK